MNIDHLRSEFLEAIADAGDLDTLDQVRVAALGKKGRLTEQQHAATVDVEFERRQALIEDYVPGCSFELFSRSCNGPSSKLARSAAVPSPALSLAAPHPSQSAILDLPGLAAAHGGRR